MHGYREVTSLLSVKERKREDKFGLVMSQIQNYVSATSDTKLCVCSPQVFFICDTALHCKIVTKNLHRTALHRKSYI